MRTLVKFALVGATGVVVNLGVFALLIELGVNRYLASPLAIEASILSNFFLHDAWTFRWRNRRGRARTRALQFNLVSLVSLAVSYGSFLALGFLLPTSPVLLHQALSIPPGTLVNFVVNSRWTFRGEQDPTG